jgi:hypothetical protein
LQDDEIAKNSISGQIAAAKEKQNVRLFGWDYSTELNIKNMKNSPSLPLVTYSASSD